MATFVANAQFSIDEVDLGFYLDNVVAGAFEEDSNLSFFGSTYPDHFYVTANDGSENLRLDIYGQNIVVSFLGTITGGTINAVGEFDVNSSTQRWYATGFSADAATTFNAALSASNADDIAVIQNALSGADTLTLSHFNDTMSGYGGNDTIKGRGGDDELDGGSGSDTAILDASFAQATIDFDGDVVVITTAADGTDRLSNCEFVSFGGDVRSVASLLPPNDPPVVTAAAAAATEDGSTITGQLQATDAQGDSLVFARTGSSIAGLTINSNGAYSFNPSVAAYQGLGAGEMQQIVANFSVSDGRELASSTLTITVTGVNDAPSFQLSERSLDTSTGEPIQFVTTASDVDGDQLTYAVTSTTNGTLTAGAGGTFTYTPNPGFTGTDTFSVQASDGKGGTATQNFSVTVAALNSIPVIAQTGIQLLTATNIPKVFSVSATDPDGDTLTYSAVDPAHGSVSGGTNGQFTYTPDLGFSGSDSILVTVADGKGGSATQTYTVTVTETPTNTPPVIASTDVNFVTKVNTAKGFTVSASDADGDGLTYAAADPAHGSISGGANGLFTYTPDAGYVGTDTILVTVTDGNGGSDVETFTVSVGELIPLQREFSLLASSGFTSSIGGYGNVFGTAGNEDITVLGRAGAITLDPSFNKGGDIVRLSGDAADWEIAAAGSAAILSNGETFVEIPAGTAGIAIVFDDGARILRIDTEIASLRIGTQAFGEASVQISAPAQNGPLPTGSDPEAFANLLMQPNGSVVAGGVLNVFGTSGGDETIDLLFGDISFDPSFNKGGDLLIIEAPASSFTALVEGTSVFLSNGTLDADIPAGIAGLDIRFGSGDERTLLINTGLGAIVLGEQAIGLDPIALAAA